MTAPRGLPAGRAGRIWLLDRLRTAERAVELLDHKLTLLRTWERQAQRASEQAEAAWTEQCRQAETWQTRALMLGGQRALRVVGAAPPAEVRVGWRTSMGLHVPSEGGCRFTDPPATSPTPSSTALVLAAEAHRAALTSAVQSAVARAALAAVRSEIALTSRRRRAIQNSRIPTLTRCLATIEMALDELERGDAARLRWAARRDIEPPRREAP
jgi:V/A-type H+-transporting ATPase subunit D